MLVMRNEEVTGRYYRERLRARKPRESDMKHVPLLRRWLRRELCFVPSPSYFVLVLCECTADSTSL
jgi:hypothetical protein